LEAFHTKIPYDGVDFVKVDNQGSHEQAGGDINQPPSAEA